MFPLLEINIEEVLTEELNIKEPLLNTELVEMCLVFSKRYKKNTNFQWI